MVYGFPVYYHIFITICFKKKMTLFQCLMSAVMEIKWAWRTIFGTTLLTECNNENTGNMIGFITSAMFSAGDGTGLQAGEFSTFMLSLWSHAAVKKEKEKKICFEWQHMLLLSL